MSDREGPSLVERPPVRGVVVGAGVWLVSYLVTWGVLVTALAGSNLVRLARGFGVGVNWRIAGWGFYAAHFVPVKLIQERGGGGAFNPFGDPTAPAQFPDALPLALLTGSVYVLPVAFLVCAGAVVVLWVDPDDLVTAVHTGSYVALGYAPLTLLGAVLFPARYPGFAGSPNLVFAIVVAGGVYPFAMGAFGGGLAFEYT